MITSEVIRLARKNLNGSSARVCLADAISLSDAGDLTSAKERALKSLQYSVGLFHPDYKKAAK